MDRYRQGDLRDDQSVYRQPWVFGQDKGIAAAVVRSRVLPLPERAKIFLALGLEQDAFVLFVDLWRMRTKNETLYGMIPDNAISKIDHHASLRETLTLSLKA